MAAENTIRVRAFSQIFNQDEAISLATVVDGDNLPLTILNQLKKVRLSDAPNVGEKRIYSPKALAEAIRASSVQKNWSMQIPNEVVVENKGFIVDSESVEKLLLNSWLAICGECQIRIIELQLPHIPPAVMKAQWNLILDNKLPRGNFSVRLSIGRHGGQSIGYWVNGQVQIKKRVPVLARSTPMGKRLEENDFKFEWRDVTLATDSNPEGAEIIGQKLKFTMNSDSIIWANSIVKEKVVQRGEIVKVVVADSNWQVSTQAQTQQDGFIGDMVNLKNLNTNKIITGKVIGSGRVEIQ